MPTPKRASSTIISLELSSADAQMIRAAAKAKRLSIEQFILKAALKEVERILAASLKAAIDRGLADIAAGRVTDARTVLDHLERKYRDKKKSPRSSKPKSK